MRLMLKLTTPSPYVPLSDLNQKWAGLLEQLGLRTPPIQWVRLPPQVFAAPALPLAATYAELEAVSAECQAVAALAVVTLTAHLLGTFRVTVNDLPVCWSRSRCQALFKYLLTHRERPTPRDVLMDIFWPEAEPESARNCLNVAMSHLRKALRSATDEPLVIHEGGAYRLNPEVCLWLDVDEFERRVREGKRLEAAGCVETAVAEYETALNLYQGDFLAEDPYEGWPVLTRERMRADYMEILDRLSEIYFKREQYTACVALCQRLLAYDNCREDAHGRLMRCYSRQSQYPMALRQYQTCVEALKTELDVTPAPATTHLVERIRRRERV